MNEIKQQIKNINSIEEFKIALNAGILKTKKSTYLANTISANNIALYDEILSTTNFCQ